jgi:undecaprenyl-diphosphatase
MKEKNKLHKKVIHTNIYELIDNTREVFLPYGAIGLFGLAFIESSFFVVPPDVLLIPLCIMAPELALFYAAVCTLGSVAGAIFGYYLGYKGGRPILLKYASNENIHKVQDLFKEHGALAVGLAGFTPIPYKIFAISSGVFKFKLHPFIIVSIIGRGARFFIEAIILMYYGKDILVFISAYFEIVTVTIGIVVVLIYLIYKKFKKGKHIMYAAR